MSRNQIIAGLDIGNGYVKGMASCGRKQEPSIIDIPSCVLFRHVVDSMDLKTTEDRVGEVVGDIYNQMDVAFSTPLVSNGQRVLFGRRAIETGKSLTEFDVQAGRESKATKQLTSVLILGSLAGKALQDYYNRYGKLPGDTLKAEARIAAALPISEYKRYWRQFAAQFMGGSHLVTFYNFEQLVRVEITFADVQVLAEGASAQYAITAKGRPLMEAMLKDVRSRGVPLEGITEDDVLAAQNTVGIDIGEGTINFPVYQGGRFNPDVSTTYGKGYGTILNEAWDVLRGEGVYFASRKALADFIQAPVTPLNRALHDKVREAVDNVTMNFCDEVVNEFRRLMEKVGIYTEVVYVYGGGATAMKDVLYPGLLDAVSRDSGTGRVAGCPILYLDSGYSRKLNREGLYLVAVRLADYQEAQEKKG